MSVRSARRLTWAGLGLTLLGGAALAGAEQAQRPALLLLPVVDQAGLWPAGSLRAFQRHLAFGLAQGSPWEPGLAEPKAACLREDCARRLGHDEGAAAVLFSEVTRAGPSCKLVARLLDLRGGPTRTLLRRRGPCSDVGLRVLADRLLEALHRERPLPAARALARLGTRAAQVELRRRVLALAESVFLRGLAARDRVLPALHRSLDGQPPDCEAVRTAVREEQERIEGWMQRKAPEVSDLLKAAAGLRARLPAAAWQRLFSALEGDVRAAWTRLTGQVAEELGASDRMFARLQAACPVLSLELTAQVRSFLEARLTQLLDEAQALGLAPGPAEESK